MKTTKECPKMQSIKTSDLIVGIPGACLAKGYACSICVKGEKLGNITELNIFISASSVIKTELWIVPNDLQTKDYSQISLRVTEDRVEVEIAEKYVFTDVDFADLESYQQQELTQIVLLGCPIINSSRG